jgi:hypothetical protein
VFAGFAKPLKILPLIGMSTNRAKAEKSANAQFRIRFVDVFVDVFSREYTLQTGPWSRVEFQVWSAVSS